MKFTITTAALAFTAMSTGVHASECAMPTDSTVFNSSSASSWSDTMLQCITDSGFSMSGTTTDSIEAIQAQLCASSACKEMIGIFEELWPTECTFEGTAIYADVIDKVNTVCNWPSSHVTTATSSASFTGTGALALVAVSAAAMAVLL